MDYSILLKILKLKKEFIILKIKKILIMVLKDKIKFLIFLGYNDDAVVIKYTTLNSFHYTINQKPNEDIPLCNIWDYYAFNINLVGDYKP